MRRILRMTTAFGIALVVVGAMLSLFQFAEMTPTGAAISYRHVGYVAVKDFDTLKESAAAVRRMPVQLSTGRFRGHYYLRIEGSPNSVYAATKASAVRAQDLRKLVYAGVQRE